MTSDDRPLSMRARKKVKEQMEKAERERLMKLFQRRMELARDGALAYREGKLKEAVQNYYTYIDILERTKSVGRDKLEPTHFDMKQDVAELLLLSGVFWDLAKIHDRSAKSDMTRLRFYLDRFVLFSKNMPFHHVSSELVRKYLVNGTPRHRKEFKDSHIRLGGGKCFIATALEDECEPGTLDRLRVFRDLRLQTNPWGRGAVRMYYTVSPTVARGILRLPEAIRRFLGASLSRFSRILQ
jgi:hypothetical protein